MGVLSLKIYKKSIILIRTCWNRIRYYYV